MPRSESQAIGEVIGCTVRVEVNLPQSGWKPTGTAFFVAEGQLVTCAHVLQAGRPVRIVWHQLTGAGERVVVETDVIERLPAHGSGDPFPLPDVALLEVRGDVGEHPTVWLEEDDGGRDLFAVGYTKSYLPDAALAHSCRLDRGGPEQVDEHDARLVIGVTGAKLGEGMSGSPVLDLTRRRVVGILKRRTGAQSEPGGWFVPMRFVFEALPAVADANAALHCVDTDEERLAVSLWGTLVDFVAARLRTHPDVLELVAAKLGLDAADDAHRVAALLFASDLEELLALANQVSALAGKGEAATLLQLVAVCTSYRNRPWVAPDAAAELRADVELAAREGLPGARFYHLRSSEPGLRRAYLRMGDREREWALPLPVPPIFDHTPDVSRDLRVAIAGRFGGPGSDFLEAELSAAAATEWPAKRERWTSLLRRQRVVALLNRDTPLDAALMEELSRDFPMIIFAATPKPPPDDALGRLKALDPAVEDNHASEAFEAYIAALYGHGVTEENDARPT